MVTRKQTAVANLRQKSGAQKFWVGFKKNWMLHLMMLMPIAYLIIFHYLPLYGLQIAFRDYRPRAGILGSEWVGLEHFKAFFDYYKWADITWNTLAISLYSIAVGFPIPIILALIIHVSRRTKLKKLAQNLSFIPNFISVVVMIGLLNQILNPITGLVGAFNSFFGTINYNDIRSNPDAFRHLYVWSDVWQSMGWSSIIYVAALSGVSQELHEAAMMDGASRWRRIFSVDLPAIMPTIAIMLILRFGSIMSVGFEKAYLMRNSFNIDTSELISTYVYVVGIGENRLSYGSAVGLMNSVINTIMIVIVNKVANWLSDGEAGLF